MKFYLVIICGLLCMSLNAQLKWRECPPCWQAYSSSGDTYVDYPSRDYSYAGQPWYWWGYYPSYYSWY